MGVGSWKDHDIGRGQVRGIERVADIRPKDDLALRQASCQAANLLFARAAADDQQGRPDVGKTLQEQVSAFSWKQESDMRNDRAGQAKAALGLL